MFELTGTHNLHGVYDTEQEAIETGVAARVEAFEVRRIADDLQVYVEFPQPTWC